MTRPATPASATDIDVTLPAQLLWGAAQCAHSDDWKGALVAVQVVFRWNDAESVHATIRSCDGSLAYRAATIAKGSCDALTSSESEPVQVLILAAQLRKILKTESTITVARIAGQLRVQGFKMGIRPDAEYLDGCEYPDLDKVWPGAADLQCKPGGFIAFSGKYLETIGKVAQRTTDKGILRLFTGSPAQPAVLQTDRHQGLDHPAFLLMPVVCRD